MSARINKKKKPIADEIADEMWGNLFERESALAEEQALERLDDELEVVDSLEGVRARRRDTRFGDA